MFPIKDEDRTLLIRTFGVVAGAIVTVAIITTMFVFIKGEPGARWDLAMKHIMFGVMGGPIMVAALIGFHFINAWLKRHSRERNQ